jgi:chaperonin GroEL
MLCLNKAKSIMKSCAVRSPGFGDRKALLEDIALVTGGAVIGGEVGGALESAGLEMVGACSRAIITKDATILEGGSGAASDVQARVKTLKSQALNAGTAQARERIEDRIARLAGGIAVIKVGAASEVEMKEKKARVEDAVYATRAAVEEGIVIGGGVALVRCAMKLQEQMNIAHALKGSKYSFMSPDAQAGFKLVRTAIEEPFRAIVTNAGRDPGGLIARVWAKGKNYGYNAARDCFEDLVAAGVIDPTKVVRCCLQNAASVAGMMLTTECVIDDLPDPEEAARTAALRKVMGV